jgi:cell division protein ZapA
MSDLSIKIKIADKEYTVRIVPEDEKIFRQASEKLSIAIKAKKEQMRIYDKTDLLAMVAFDCIFDQLQAEQSQNAVNKKLELMQQRILVALSEDNAK